MLLPTKRTNYIIVTHVFINNFVNFCNCVNIFSISTSMGTVYRTCICGTSDYIHLGPILKPILVNDVIYCTRRI